MFADERACKKVGMVEIPPAYHRTYDENIPIEGCPGDFTRQPASTIPQIVQKMCWNSN